MLELHYWPTPNGKKVTILLEELGVAHRIVPMNIGRGDQFTPDFLKMAPNNRMPALIDTEPKGGGGPLSIFESGAIMMYIAEKEGRFFPQATAKKYDVIQWIMWQMANQGPKMGEQGHFFRASTDAKNGDLAYAGQVRFGLAGKGLWSELDRLRAGPARKGVVPIEPVLRASIRFFGRHKGGFIRDGVLLLLLPTPQ